MIDIVLKLIEQELRAHFKPPGADAPPDDPVVELGNIGTIDPEDPASRVIITLANLAEEATKKNESQYQRNGDRNRVQNPPTYLNLFLIFAASYPANEYAKAITRLSEVITFLQGKNVFTPKNSPESASGADQDLRITLELMTLTFEQVNYVWAIFGGKQVPFAMYKARLVKVQADRPLSEVTPIDEVAGNEARV